MIVLGINGGVRLGYQDVSAALVADGQLIAAVEEERLSRIKFSPGMISERSIAEVLSLADISIHEVDVIATHGETWGDAWKSTLRNYMRTRFGHCPEIATVHHHDAHAASAFYASGFPEAMVLTADNSGDGITTQLSLGNTEGITVLERVGRPNSIGLFYTMLTQFCGFTRDSDEYKLMGLSAYGNRTVYDFSEMLSVDENGFRFDISFLPEVKAGMSFPARQEPIFTEKLLRLLGPSRMPGSEMQQKYRDIAAGAQAQQEEALVALVTKLHRMTGQRRLCLAGGVALNCLANHRLLSLPFVDEIFVQPAAGDAGISAGAAYAVAAKHGEEMAPMQNAFLGRSYSNAEMEAVLKSCGVNYRRTENPAGDAALRIAEGKVVAWFQGRAEYGPRALGARSILADPGKPGMNDRVNERIKFRESFRPFAPAVREEQFHSCFDSKVQSSPYMTVTFPVKAAVREILPATTHVDGTARVQTVTRSRNPLFYELLGYIGEYTGTPAVLNTSFNVKGQPMVYSPHDALATFFSTGLDVLVIGNYVVMKNV